MSRSGTPSTTSEGNPLLAGRVQVGQLGGIASRTSTDHIKERSKRLMNIRYGFEIRFSYSDMVTTFQGDYFNLSLG